MKIPGPMIAALLLFLIILLTGTIFYYYVEGWNIINSFYFTGVTITTIGYGDIAPVTDLGKIFTVFFAIAGIGITLYVIINVVNSYVQKTSDELINRVIRFKHSFEKGNNNKTKKIRVVVDNK